MKTSIMVARLLACDEFNEPSLAKALGTSQPTIHRIKNGSHPRYELGRRIETLYLSRLGDDVNSGDTAA